MSRIGNVFIKEEKLKNKQFLYNYNYGRNERGFIINRISAIFKPSACKKRGMWPDITKQRIWELLLIHVQDMKEKFPESDGRICTYCEQPWTYRPGDGTAENTVVNKRNFSIDRFDNALTYSEKNIVFCCTECNDAKHSVPLRLIKKIYKMMEERNYEME